jgi:hypothetical protein
MMQHFEITFCKIERNLYEEESERKREREKANKKSLNFNQELRIRRIGLDGLEVALVVRYFRRGKRVIVSAEIKGNIL